MDSVRTLSAVRGHESGQLECLSGGSERCVGVNRTVTIIKWWQQVVHGRESGGYNH